MHDVAPATLPQKVWMNMTKYAFVKEQMVRPGGVYPKYGAVDRDYYGPEYDGFQDIFTSSLRQYGVGPLRDGPRRLRQLLLRLR
jgi:hypothetical protein